MQSIGVASLFALLLTQLHIFYLSPERKKNKKFTNDLVKRFDQLVKNSLIMEYKIVKANTDVFHAAKCTFYLHEKRNYE